MSLDECARLRDRALIVERDIVALRAAVEAAPYPDRILLDGLDRALSHAFWEIHTAGRILEEQT